MKKIIFLCAAGITLTFVGCANHTVKPLYSWGSYPQQAYLLMSEAEKTSVAAQILLLEKEMNKAQAANLALPPGFYAHLGLLHLDTHNSAKAAEYFQLERQIYPESTTLMNRLLTKLTGQTPTGVTQ